MKDLTYIQKLFNDSIFRIPDYQRGYSWTIRQLEEFWNDIIGLRSNQNHYTGMLSLNKISKEIIDKNESKWLKEKWLIDAGYDVYEVVDGQQRLTTIIIFINQIIEFCESHNYREINNNTIEEVKNKYLYKIKPSTTIKTYKFGYETDNPSYKYFKKEILHDKTEAEEIEETFYTLNLKKAKEFFTEKIKEIAVKKGFKELENIYRKITLQLKFNVYEINEDFSVFVAFETMNNRGKRLSYLELLKNRLIYLTTLFEVEENDKKIIREKIDMTWKNIYGYLGKNPERLLNDDEFLQHHWIIYFGHHTRKIDGKTTNFHTYILNKYFIQQNINSELDYVPYLEDEMIEPQEQIIEMEQEDKKQKITLTMEDIERYINSLNELIKFWYQTYEPQEIKNLEIRKYLFRLSELGYVNSRPLITVLLSKEDINDEIKLEIIKSIERYNFLYYRLNSYNTTNENTVFYNLARDLYVGTKNVEDIFKVTKRIEFIGDNGIVKCDTIIDKFEKLFKWDGFYSWDSKKYLLYIYDVKDAETPAENRLNIKDYFKVDERDSYSVEHIYPRKPKDSYWTTRFNEYSEKERNSLTGSLGNLLPLSKRINSKLQNNSFDDKKERYKNGSNSERKVAEELEWTPKEILNRGIEMIRFMEKEFEFEFPNDAVRKKFLGLEFMIEDEDYKETKEPYFKEKDKETSTREFNLELYQKQIEKVDPKIVEIYKEIEVYCESLIGTTKHTTKNYVAFYSNQVYVEFHFHNAFAHILLCDIEYDDPQKLTYNLGKNYQWSKTTRVDIKPETDIEYIKNLINQSYESLN